MHHKLHKIKAFIAKTIAEAVMPYIQQDYSIVEYWPKKNIEDLQYIKTNKDILWNFFNDGYLYVGLDGFKSCFNPKALIKNAILLKVAYDNQENIIAASIYTNRDGGYKLVGITATTNELLRPLGKQAVKDIVKYDMQHYDQYYWTVCSDALYHMCIKAGGIQIPNTYALGISDRFIPVNSDDYKIKIQLADGDYYEKYIIGFNSKETYDLIIKQNDQRVLKMINNINRRVDPTQINETIEYSYSKEEAAHKIINLLYDERCEVFSDFSTQLIEVLQKNILILQEYIESHNDNKAILYKQDIENAQDIMDSTTRCEIYKF